MKIAFFDAKPYDRPSFQKYGEPMGITIKYFETKLNEDTVDLAHGYDGVCVFVNDSITAPVIDRLVQMGVRYLALRCAGFNNVDMKHAFGKLHVFHVPAYSPYAVAEHTMALLLTSIRRIHKAFIRTKDFNFSLSGFTGFDLHGKTVGVIGTGRIGRVFIDICRGFGMKLLAYDKYPVPDLDNGGTIRYVSLDELFQNSDIISLFSLQNKLFRVANVNFIMRGKAIGVGYQKPHGGVFCALQQQHGRIFANLQKNILSEVFKAYKTTREINNAIFIYFLATNARINNHDFPRNISATARMSLSLVCAASWFSFLIRK